MTQYFNDSAIQRCLRMTTSNGKTNQYYIETYGCQMNVRDSETVSGILDKAGFTPSTKKEDADLILFNTCCVREHAEKRLMGNIGALKKAKEENPELIIGICGCMMQQKGMAEKLSKRFPFVDFFIGTHNLDRFPDVLADAMSGIRTVATEEGNKVIEGMPSSPAMGSSAFVNIMYGCDNYCTYCIVPYVRGHERSRNPEDIEAEIRQRIAEGYTEITLLGQNVNSYGNTADFGIRFPELLERLSKIDGLKRLRFMTSHPKDLSDELIRVISECSTVCHHIHLPVQSGSNEILRKMNRKYTREQYIDLVERIRKAIPDIELTTDIIVGFPGETEQDFEDTVALVQTVGYSAAYTFKYSPRTGTIAAKMEDQIPEDVKKSRLERLNNEQLKSTKKNSEKYLGFSGEVLVEGIDEKGSGMVFGKFSNCKMIYFPGRPEDVGGYMNVRCTAIKNHSLYGERETV